MTSKRTNTPIEELTFSVEYRPAILQGLRRLKIRQVRDLQTMTYRTLWLEFGGLLPAVLQGIADHIDLADYPVKAQSQLNDLPRHLSTAAANYLKRAGIRTVLGLRLLHDEDIQLLKGMVNRGIYYHEVMALKHSLNDT